MAIGNQEKDPVLEVGVYKLKLRKRDSRKDWGLASSEEGRAKHII
jgi:hypothetical protein